MNILKDIPPPPARNRRDNGTPRREPIAGITATLDGMQVGECLEVGEPASAHWGYQRAYDATGRWAHEGRAYRASRGSWGWRIWRVR